MNPEKLQFFKRFVFYTSELSELSQQIRIIFTKNELNEFLLCYFHVSNF